MPLIASKHIHHRPVRHERSEKIKRRKKDDGEAKRGADEHGNVVHSSSSSSSSNGSPAALHININGALVPSNKNKHANNHSDTAATTLPSSSANFTADAYTTQ